MTIYEVWKNYKFVATADTWTEMLPQTRGKRYFLKIHNRSKEVFLKVGWSQEEIDNDIYHLVGPGGFWEFSDTEIVPRNGIFINGEGADTEVILTIAEDLE